MNFRYNASVYKGMFAALSIMSLMLIIYGVSRSLYLDARVRAFVEIAMVFAIFVNGLIYYVSKYRGNNNVFMVAILYFLSTASVTFGSVFFNVHFWFITMFFIFNAIACFVMAVFFIGIAKDPTPTDFFSKYTR